MNGNQDQAAKLAKVGHLLLTVGGFASTIGAKIVRTHGDMLADQAKELAAAMYKLGRHHQYHGIAAPDELGGAAAHPEPVDVVDADVIDTDARVAAADASPGSARDTSAPADDASVPPAGHDASAPAPGDASHPAAADVSYPAAAEHDASHLERVTADPATVSGAAIVTRLFPRDSAGAASTGEGGHSA